MIQSLSDLRSHHPDVVQGHLDLLEPRKTVDFNHRHRGAQKPKGKALHPRILDQDAGLFQSLPPHRLRQHQHRLQARFGVQLAGDSYCYRN